MARAAAGYANRSDPKGEHRMDVNPIELQKHLKGMSYPASKDDVVAKAESNGAPDEIISALQGMSKDQFDGPSAVQQALK